MNQKKLSAAVFVLALTMAGCQTVPYVGQAREVKRKPKVEGIIALAPQFRDEDRAKAEEKMQSNCAPNPVKILEEGEVVVGQEVKSNAKESDRASTQTKLGSVFGIPVTSGQAGGKDVASSSTTTSLKEWQISYACDQKSVKR
jgi:hypothetical protein